MKTVLVTGGNSFTARHLIPVLKADGLNVRQLCNSNDDVKDQDLFADITDLEALRVAISGVDIDYVIHLAGISFAAHQRPLELYNVNVLGTENLLKAFNDNAPNVHKIILASSANIYGAQAQSNPVLDESLCPEPVNHYAVSKLAMEHMSRTWMDRLPITCVRPFNYTGRGQDEKFLVPKIISHFARKADAIELGNIDVARDFTDVRVISKCYLKILHAEKAIGETVNICSGRLTKLKEIAAFAEEITGHSLDIKVNPDFVRKSDIMELRGDPTYLHSLIGPVEHPEIRETLAWMLQDGVTH